MKHEHALECGRRLLALVRDSGACPVITCTGRGIHELGLVGDPKVVTAAHETLDLRTRFAMTIAAHHEWPDPNACCSVAGMTRQ